jgi:hypothetical protein
VSDTTNTAGAGVLLIAISNVTRLSGRGGDVPDRKGKFRINVTCAVILCPLNSRLLHEKLTRRRSNDFYRLY